MIHTFAVICPINISIYVVNIYELNGPKEEYINKNNQYFGNWLWTIKKITKCIYDNKENIPNDKEHFEIFQNGKIFWSTRTRTQIV